MGFLSDEEVRRIASQLPPPFDEREGAVPEALVMLRWLRQLLEDRHERSTVILGLSRHLHHLRERLRDAGTYFDKLAADAHKLTLVPWPGSKKCPRCGAPLAITKGASDRDPTVVGDVHPDGKRCAPAVRSPA